MRARHRLRPLPQIPELEVPRWRFDAAAGTAAIPLLEELEDLLRSPQPVYCAGMARAWRLITDGCGPLYAQRREGELCERLHVVLAALRGGAALTARPR